MRLRESGAVWMTSTVDPENRTPHLLHATKYAQHTDLFITSSGPELYILYIWHVM